MAARSIPKGMQTPNGKGSMPAAVIIKRLIPNLLKAGLELESELYQGEAGYSRVYGGSMPP